MNNFEKVCQFHETFKVPGGVQHTPTVPSREIMMLRLRLISEELCEMAQSCGMYMEVHCRDYISSEVFMENSDSRTLQQVVASEDKCDEVEVADAIADLLYVVYGSAAVFGVPANMVFNEVHRSNMSKLFNDGPHFREDGKVLKGPNYKEPNIAVVMSQYQQQQEMGSGAASVAVYDAE